MKKQTVEPLYDSLCAYCEYATATDDEDTVFCNKKKKNVPLDGICHSFIYDLLKREPQIPTFQEVELPII